MIREGKSNSIGNLLQEIEKVESLIFEMRDDTKVEIFGTSKNNGTTQFEARKINRGTEKISRAVIEINKIEQEYKNELALDLTTVKGKLLMFLKRKRFKELSNKVDILLELITDKRKIDFVNIRLPKPLDKRVKTKLAIAALIAIGYY